MDYDLYPQFSEQPEDKLDKLLQQLRNIQEIIGIEISPTSSSNLPSGLHTYPDISAYNEKLRKQKKPKTLSQQIQEIQEKFSRFEEQFTNIEYKLTQIGTQSHESVKRDYLSNQQVETSSREAEVIRKEISTSNQQIKAVTHEIRIIKEELSKFEQYFQVSEADWGQQIKAVAQQVEAFDNNISEVRKDVSNIAYQLSQTLEQRFDVLSKQLHNREVTYLTLWKFETEPLKS